MKETIISGFVIGLAMAVFSLPMTASAEEDKEVRPTASAGVAVMSKYVWRGYEFSDESVVIQPSLTGAYKGFSLNLWGNLDTSYDDGDSLSNDSSDLNETDVTFAYDTSIGDFDVGVGYIYYALEGHDAEELYASVCATALPLSPTLTVYRDITEFIGWYLNLGVSHSFDLGHDITLDLAGSVGYYESDDDDFTEADSDDKYSAFHDGLISVGLTIPVAEYITLSPMIAYSFALSGEADDLIEASNQGYGFGTHSDTLFGGITLSVAF